MRLGFWPPCIAFEAAYLRRRAKRQNNIIATVIIILLLFSYPRTHVSFSLSFCLVKSLRDKFKTSVPRSLFVAFATTRGLPGGQYGKMPKLNYYDDRRQRYPVTAGCCGNAAPGDALGGITETGPSPPHHQVVDACVGMPPSQMHQSMGTTTMQTSYDQCYSDYYHLQDGFPQQHYNQPNSSLALLSPSSSSHSTTSLPSNSPDNNNYLYGCYGRQPNGYNSSVSPSSSSSYYSANSPTDCYGVPAHPSATVNYHSAVNQHNNAGYSRPQSMAYATPPQHHNNNNNYTPSCSYQDYSAVADDKPGRHK